MKPSLFFLGPEGSFTHQAALNACSLPLFSSRLGTQSADFALMDSMLKDSALTDSTLINVVAHQVQLISCLDAHSVLEHVEHGDGFGMIAWENNVDGYVVPNLDALIEANNIAGVARVSVDVSFDAFVVDDQPVREVCAHSHGLAQCKRFIKQRGLTNVPYASNTAACQAIHSGQVALGPALCGQLYGLKLLQSHVQDYDSARTDFLLLAPRSLTSSIMQWYREQDGQFADACQEFESVIVFIPLHTGPGVLADLLVILRDAGLNMTSFITRPIKGCAGMYSFIATIDAAPWQPSCVKVLQTCLRHGDWVKTLACYPRASRQDLPVEAWQLPQGGVLGSQTQLSSQRDSHFDPQFDLYRGDNRTSNSLDNSSMNVSSNNIANTITSDSHVSRDNAHRKAATSTSALIDETHIAERLLW